MKICDLTDNFGGYTAVRIDTGKSGADVYEIDGKYIFKSVSRGKLNNSELFSAYKREVLFYKWAAEHKETGIYQCIPETKDFLYSDEKIYILMKKYETLNGMELDTEVFRKIMAVLARIHTCAVPDFLHRDAVPPSLFTLEQLQAFEHNWNGVLDEHPGVFDKGPLELLVNKLNDIILWHSKEEQVLIHGDFHRDNLLADKNGSMLICDWQGVGEGGASGDISFFLSRLSADGVTAEACRLVELYTNEIKLMGKSIDADNILAHMDAANVITSFVFWHEYLIGSSAERVGTIYSAMVSGLEHLCALGL